MSDEIPERYRRGFPHKDAYADQKILCPNAKTIFDVGANAGYTALKYRKLFPDAVIHAFEPAPETFDKLRARFASDGQVHCVAKALSSSPGTARLHLNSMDVTNALSAILDEASSYLPENLTETGGVNVETTTLDNYLASEGIDRIDLLKMDTQGAELDILRGGEKALAGGRIGLVYTELIFIPVYERQAAFHEIAAFLASFGYQIFDFFGFTYHTDGQLKWGDAIFVHKSRRAA